MIKNRHTPFWVYLAFSAVETRKGGFMLTASCVLLTCYCIPWGSILDAAPHSLLGELFIFDDWHWAGLMMLVSLWYIASLHWMEKNNGWERRPAGFDG